MTPIDPSVSAKFKLNIVFLLLADENKSEDEKDENRQREIK